MGWGNGYVVTFMLTDVAKSSDTAVAQMHPRSSLQIAECMRDNDMAVSHCLDFHCVLPLLNFEKEVVQTATSLP